MKNFKGIIMSEYTSQLTILRHFPKIFSIIHMPPKPMLTVKQHSVSVASLSASRSHCGGDRCLTSCGILWLFSGFRSAQFESSRCWWRLHWYSRLGHSSWRPTFLLPCRSSVSSHSVGPGSACQGLQDVVSVADPCCRLCAVHVES